MLTIREYADYKGINNKDTLAELDDYLDDIYYLKDAHKFPFKSFIVRFNPTNINNLRV
jgi:hypothetical protein